MTPHVHWEWNAQHLAAHVSLRTSVSLWCGWNSLTYWAIFDLETYANCDVSLRDALRQLAREDVDRYWQWVVERGLKRVSAHRRLR